MTIRTEPGDGFVAVLFVWMVADIAWIWAHNPRDKFAHYLVLFGVVGIGTVALSTLVRKGLRAPPLVAIAVAAGVCVTEELLCYVTRTGIFEDGTFSLAAGLTVGVLALVLWSLGALFTSRWSGLDAWQLYVLWAVSGLLNEFVIVPRGVPTTLVGIVVLPGLAIPYVTLVWLPNRLMAADKPPHPAAWWWAPLAVLLPTAGFIAGAAGGLLLTGRLADALKQI